MPEPEPQYSDAEQQERYDAWIVGRQGWAAMRLAQQEADDLAAAIDVPGLRLEAAGDVQAFDLLVEAAVASVMGTDGGR